MKQPITVFLCTISWCTITRHAGLTEKSNYVNGLINILDR